MRYGNPNKYVLICKYMFYKTCCGIWQGGNELINQNKI